MASAVLSVVGPGWRDAIHGGEDDVRPETERDGIANLRRTEKEGRPSTVSEFTYKLITFLFKHFCKAGFTFPAAYTCGKCPIHPIKHYMGITYLIYIY